MTRNLCGISILGLALTACANAASAPDPTPAPFVSSELARFNEPWAMTFLPDGRLLITEKQGKLKLHALGGETGDVSGVPEVAYGGQGGFGDVVVHPQFADNSWVYLSYAEEGDDNTFGAAVARAKLVVNDNGGGKLEDLAVIWRQVPKVTGRGHFGHRLAFAANGDLYISSGDRQKFTPAQDMQSNLGKIIRLIDDGSVPKDNRRTIRLPIRAISRHRSGRLAIAIRSAWLSMARVDCGRSSMGPPEAMNSTGSSAVRTTDIRLSPTATITMAAKFPITRRGPSSMRPKSCGRR